MWDPVTSQRLFASWQAFAHPVTLWIVLAVASLLGVAFALIALLRALGRTGPELHRELLQRTFSWAIMAPLLILPVLLGAAWTMGAITLLSLLCYREYARATGLFRERAISLVVVAGLLALAFASLDHWPGFFSALPALGMVLIATVAILRDEPRGYLQRVGLGALGFLLFGVCLGHLAFLANDRDYRPILLLLLVTVELNDVFAYLSGKTLGRRLLTPQTSPRKTLGGALGALLLTTSLVVVLGRQVFAGTPAGTAPALVGLGLLVSIAGQFGDLMLSSIKRDLGLKDMGVLIPGHGGLLDRFDSLILVAPAAFHYLNYLRGIGTDQPLRIFTG